jgi:hypothetical protein
MNPETPPAGPASAPTPIAELLESPDFPKSALGKWVDIGGYTGVVTDIVNQSLKVRSPEGALKSFNANGLRRIYLRVIPPEPPPSLRPSLAPSPRAAEPEEPPAAPKPPPTIEPDFTRPVKDIALLVTRPDYPQGILGEHVQIADYTGVVVQIVKRSLKVRSHAEITRSYNADALRKLYGESGGR